MRQRQLLAEGINGASPFIVDRSKGFVSEARADGKSIWRIPGRFSECGTINGNNRRYSRQVWEKNLTPGSTLLKLIEGNAAFGLLEHPADGQVTLQSNISHAVTAAKLNEDGSVTGEITLIDMGPGSDGNKLKCLIEFGYNPLVSSRGFGSLVKASDGVDDVQDDYVCEGWDVVAKPSFEGAQLAPDRSAIDTVLGRKNESVAISETAPPAAAAPVAAAPAAPAPTLKPEVSPAPTAPAPAVAAPANNKNTITESMTNIQEVKTRISALRASKPNDARGYAEGVAQMADLHQQVSEYVAEDAKRSYDGSKLHREIESIEKAWSDSQAAPTKVAAKLREDRNKVLHVCRNLVETALKYKKAVQDGVRSNVKIQAVVEELTTNGTGWMELANKRKAQRDFMTRKYQVACESLLLMANRYKEDLTIVGRHALNLEFREALSAKPELQKTLNEAKTPQEILAIREQLEGKPSPAPALESKPAPAAAAPVTESKPLAAANMIIESAVRDPRAINESAEIVRRLSLASAK